MSDAQDSMQQLLKMINPLAIMRFTHALDKKKFCWLKNKESWSLYEAILHLDGLTAYDDHAKNKYIVKRCLKLQHDLAIEAYRNNKLDLIPDEGPNTPSLSADDFHVKPADFIAWARSLAEIPIPSAWEIEQSKNTKNFSNKASKKKHLEALDKVRKTDPALSRDNEEKAVKNLLEAEGLGFSRGLYRGMRDKGKGGRPSKG